MISNFSAFKPCESNLFIILLRSEWTLFKRRVKIHNFVVNVQLSKRNRKDNYLFFKGPTPEFVIYSKLSG